MSEIQPPLEFKPDKAKQERIARFRKWTLILTAALVVFAFLLVFRTGQQRPVVESALTGRADPIREVDSGKTGTALAPAPTYPGTPAGAGGDAPAPARPAAAVQHPLRSAAAAADSINAAVQSAYARWQQAENLWLTALASPGNVGEALARVGAAQTLAESAAADVRGARRFTRAIIATQERAGLARTRVGELFSAEVAVLTELDSAAAGRGRQLRFIEQAFRALQAGDTADYYIKIENPAGAEQRRAEAALKRARRQQDRVRQALRSLELEAR